jgi:hypothetical protein
VDTITETELKKTETRLVEIIFGISSLLNLARIMWREVGDEQ